MSRSGWDLLPVGPLHMADERWRATLKVERIKVDGDRWTAEVSFAPVAFDPDYWLSRSEGFLVDSPEGAVGVVDEIVRTSAGEIGLVVAGGWFGRRRYVIPASDVEEIRPGPQRIIVRAAAVDADSRGGRRCFPFNLPEGPPGELDFREAEPKNRDRRVELHPSTTLSSCSARDDGRCGRSPRVREPRRA